MDRDWWAVVALISYMVGSICFVFGSGIMLIRELTK